jgi:ribosomal protein L7/L12
MTSPEETMVDYNQVFDKLVSEISSAQAELDMIQEQLRNQRSIDSVGLEAATLQEETKLWKKETPEGFVEDDQIRYYLAVGQVEELVKEMRDIKEITGKSLTGTKDTLNILNKTIKEQVDILNYRPSSSIY